jgi:hypothetical protein
LGVPHSFLSVASGLFVEITVAALHEKDFHYHPSRGTCGSIHESIQGDND